MNGKGLAERGGLKAAGAVKTWGGRDGGRTKSRPDEGKRRADEQEHHMRRRLEALSVRLVGMYTQCLGCKALIPCAAFYESAGPAQMMQWPTWMLVRGDSRTRKFCAGSVQVYREREICLTGTRSLPVRLSISTLALDPHQIKRAN
mgnify:CR=1 FL=1